MVMVNLTLTQTLKAVLFYGLRWQLRNCANRLPKHRFLGLSVSNLRRKVSRNLTRRYYLKSLLTYLRKLLRNLNPVCALRKGPSVEELRNYSYE